MSGVGLKSWKQKSKKEFEKTEEKVMEQLIKLPPEKDGIKKLNPIKRLKKWLIMKRLTTSLKSMRKQLNHKKRFIYIALHILIRGHLFKLIEKHLKLKTALSLNIFRRFKKICKLSNTQWS